MSFKQRHSDWLSWTQESWTKLIEQYKQEKIDDEMKECTFHPQVRDKTLANYNSFGFKWKKYSKQSKSFSFAPNLSQSCESFDMIKN